MLPTQPLNEERKKFEKTFREAGLGFAILFGLNTLALLAMGVLARGNGVFGASPLYFNGTIAVLAGITVGVSLGLFRRQRWAAYTGLVLCIVVPVGSVLIQAANRAVSETTAGSGPPTGGIGCGLVLFAMVGIMQYRAARIRRPSAAQIAAPEYQGPASLLRPYSSAAKFAQAPAATAFPSTAQHQPTSLPQVAQPVQYPLGKFAAAVLVVCALAILGGAATAGYGLLATPSVEESQWVVVHDSTLGVEVEMPGQPKTDSETPQQGQLYLTTRSLDLGYFYVSMSCVQLQDGWEYTEAEFFDQIRNGADPKVLTFVSDRRLQANGISMYESTFRSKHGFLVTKRGFFARRHSVTVTVAEEDSDGEVSSRVLNSLRYSK